MGKVDEALAVFEHASQLQPSNVQPRYHRAVVLMSQGLFQVSAYRHRGHPSRVSSGHPDSYQRRWHCVCVSVAQDAREELEFVMNKAPKEPTVYMQLGRVCKALVRSTLLMMMIDVSLTWGVITFCAVTFPQKDFDAAIRYFNIALDLDPKDPNQIKASCSALRAFVHRHCYIVDGSCFCRARWTRFV